MDVKRDFFFAWLQIFCVARLSDTNNCLEGAYLITVFVFFSYKKKTLLKIYSFIKWTTNGYQLPKWMVRRRHFNLQMDAISTSQLLQVFWVLKIIIRFFNKISIIFSANVIFFAHGIVLGWYVWLCMIDWSKILIMIFLGFRLHWLHSVQKKRHWVMEYWRMNKYHGWDR